MSFGPLPWPTGPPALAIYPKTNLCWAERHERFELMWTPRGRAECFLESRSMEKCAQPMFLLLNLPALFAPGNLDIISTNTSFQHPVQTW